MFELQPNHTTLAATLISNTARVQLNKNTLLLGHEMVEFVLNFVSTTHSQNFEIDFFFEKHTSPKMEERHYWQAQPKNFASLTSSVNVNHPISDPGCN